MVRVRHGLVHGRRRGHPRRRGRGLGRPRRPGRAARASPARPGVARVKALILAAGRGTRLGALTQSCPKPMLDLGGRPILEHIVSGIRDHAGIREFAVVTGYLAERITAHFGDGARLGVRIHFRHQPRQDGTGSAVHLARDLLGDAPFLLTWGDIVVSTPNYGGIVAAFQRAKCDAMLGLNWVEDPAAGAAVYLGNASRVTRIVEKPPPGTSSTRWNNAGFGVLGPAIWAEIERLAPSPRGEYELPRAIAALVASGANVRAVPVEGPWFDVGTPDDLAAARTAFANNPRGKQ
ncbi:nucleotidyltransferase family protein [bacterium]|nr:MAG: nucleotidyltransferase family protein [bacterium]